MRRYLRSSAVNGPVWARGYTRAMMTKRFLTICAAVAAGTAAGTSLALAQSYPPPPGAVYSTPSPPYVPGGYPADYRRGPGGPDLDAREEAERPNTAARPRPGPVVSPEDPRYGRRPVYTDRAMPTGPILSPDDPRYGRPDGAPPVYSDRRGAPTGPILSPDDPRYGRPDGPPPVIYSDRAPGDRAPGDNGAPRPPEAVGGAPGGVTGSVQQPPVGADGRPMVLSALPPDEQPEVAPAQLAPNLRRQEVTFPTKEPAGTLIVDTPNTHPFYVLGGRPASPFRGPVRPAGFSVARRPKILPQAQ